jgi:sugar lactone lactonase YvrE
MSTAAPTASVELECVCDYAAKTGESPVWSVAEQALYWIDIQEPAVHRFDPASGEDRRWSVPDEIGCLALHATGDRAIVGLRSGLCELQLSTGALRELARAPFDPALFRFNEGGCDRTGRFWLGTMYDPKNPNLKPAQLKGEWHSYSGREGLVPHRDFAVIPNGLGWDADFRTMYVSHSQDRAIYAYEFDAEAGRLGDRRIFATIPQALGIPDGCAIDADGGYWSALHGGGRLRRFRSNGEFDYDVHLPVSLPTMCAFGGAALDTLYVTSKSLGLTPKQRSLEPLAGKLLRFRPGIHGRPTAVFGG